MSVSIKKLKRCDIQEFTQLIAVFERVFEMQGFSIPPENHLQELLIDDKFMVFVAQDEDQNVIAGLTAYTLVQYYSVRPLVYIFDLAVEQKFQRQGIGQALIRSINNYCKEAGMQEVFVQADKPDQYAIDFYRATAPSAEEDVTHFYYTL